MSPNFIALLSDQGFTTRFFIERAGLSRPEAIAQLHASGATMSGNKWRFPSLARKQRAEALLDTPISRSPFCRDRFNNLREVPEKSI